MRWAARGEAREGLRGWSYDWFRDGGGVDGPVANKLCGHLTLSGNNSLWQDSQENTVFTFHTFLNLSEYLTFDMQAK